MLIDTIVEYCHNKFSNLDCKACSYKEHCPNDCAKCLHYIHSPSSAPEKRTYDCERMACHYVCKYSHKYTSELVYALEQLKDIKEREKLNVLSIGCGPCTDLFALDYLNEKKIYSFENLEFRGVDLKPLWKDIHDRIQVESTGNYKVKYYYRDIFDLIDVICEKKWLPDLTVFQYVFSDMKKTTA